MDIPVASILETFYTTALLNVITWNKAYAVFPQPTFLHHKTFLLKSLTDYYGPLLGKLTSRGWKTYPTLSLDEEDGIRDAWLRRTDVGGGSEICRRRFGDKSSWIIPLPTYEIKWPDMPDSVLAYSEFEIMTEDAHTASPDLDLHVSRYHIFCPIFKSLVLRHQYIYCTVILELGDRLEALTRLELLKMKPSERPADLTQRNTFSSGRLWESTFDRPESWTYYDEDLIEWIDRAESKFCRVVKTIRDHESESEP
jgi:hypothetical protein